VLSIPYPHPNQRTKFRHFGQEFGNKPYFKATPSSNLADLLPASLSPFDPTWIIYELAGQDITDNQWTCLNALLHNKPHYEKLKKTGVFD
jgi:hypothetical protein